MVHNQEELLKRFPLLDTIIHNLSCSDADKKLLRALFLNVYLTHRTQGLSGYPQISSEPHDV